MGPVCTASAGTRPAVPNKSFHRPESCTQELRTWARHPNLRHPPKPLPLTPRAGVCSEILTDLANPSVHKKDSDANKSQGQQGSDHNPHQLGKVKDRAPISKTAKEPLPTLATKEQPGAQGAMNPRAPRHQEALEVVTMVDCECCSGNCRLQDCRAEPKQKSA